MGTLYYRPAVFNDMFKKSKCKLSSFPPLKGISFMKNVIIYFSKALHNPWDKYMGLSSQAREILFSLMTIFYYFINIS